MDALQCINTIIIIRSSKYTDRYNLEENKIKCKLERQTIKLEKLITKFLKDGKHQECVPPKKDIYIFYRD